MSYCSAHLTPTTGQSRDLRCSPPNPSLTEDEAYKKRLKEGVTFKATDREDGSYLLQFFAKTAGAYTVRVCVPHNKARCACHDKLLFL